MFTHHYIHNMSDIDDYENKYEEEQEFVYGDEDLDQQGGDSYITQDAERRFNQDDGGTQPLERYGTQTRRDRLVATDIMGDTKAGKLQKLIDKKNQSPEEQFMGQIDQLCFQYEINQSIADNIDRFILKHKKKILIKYRNPTAFLFAYNSINTNGELDTSRLKEFEEQSKSSKDTVTMLTLVRYAIFIRDIMRSSN